MPVTVKDKIIELEIFTTLKLYNPSSHLAKFTSDLEP